MRVTPEDQPLKKTKKPAVFLWNPLVAAIWSFVFTPLFGAFIHMRNWQTLDERARAKQSFCWLLGGLVIVLGNHLVSALLVSNELVDHITIALLFLYGCGWYLGSGMSQVKLVKEQFPKGYGKKKWWIPLGTALLGVFVYMCLGVVFTLLSNQIR